MNHSILFAVLVAVAAIILAAIIYTIVLVIRINNKTKQRRRVSRRRTNECNRKCPNGFKCYDGECVLDCQMGLEDCNGICTDTTASEQHCGQCGQECAPGELCIDRRCTNPCPIGTIFCRGQCISGACTPLCPTGQRFCASVEGCTSVENDVQNCSDCNIVCAPLNAVGICKNSRCEVGPCHVGFARCDSGGEGDPSNGCETNILENPRHCGGCNKPCPPSAPFCLNGYCSTFPVQEY